MESLLLAIDAGTTSFKVMAVDANGRIRAEYSRAQSHPAHVADWYAHLRSIVQESGLAKSVRALVVSGQMHGTQLIGTDGEPLGACKPWNDHTNAHHLPALLERVGDLLPRTIGSTIVSGYQALNLFCQEDWSQVQAALLPKDALIHCLTGALVTEPTDAVSTGLFHGEEGTWAWDIVAKLGIPKRVLPNIVPTGSAVGSIRAEVAHDLSLLPDTPVFIAGGDTPTAAFGAGAQDPDQQLIMLSTSAQVIRPTTTWEPDPDARWFTWPAMRMPDVKEPSWLQLATLTNGGSTLSWLQSVSPLTGAVAADPVSVLFLPHLQGQRFPKPDIAASGAFLGLRATTSQADLYRAVVQGLAFQYRRADQVMHAHGEQPANVVRFGGGASRFPGMARVLATVLERPVHHMQDADLTCLGAARIAAASLGWTLPEVPDAVVVQPDDEQVEAYRNLYEIWCEADAAFLPIAHRLYR